MAYQAVGQRAASLTIHSNGRCGAYGSCLFLFLFLIRFCNWTMMVGLHFWSLKVWGVEQTIRQLLIYWSIYVYPTMEAAILMLFTVYKLISYRKTLNRTWASPSSVYTGCKCWTSVHQDHVASPWLYCLLCFHFWSVILPLIDDQRWSRLSIVLFFKL